jgi:TolB-like protein
MKRSMNVEMPVLLAIAGLLLCGFAVPQASAQAPAKSEPAAVYPTAIFPFQERGSGATGMGEKISDILFASLSASPQIHLVDRADLKKVLEEQHLNLSGMVNPGQATQVGHLTGAKILVTGSVFEADKSLYLVAKIIGTETSRVLGASVKGKTTDELATLAEDLAKKVEATIAKQSGDLVAKEAKREDWIKALKEKLGDAKRPKVYIQVAERHVGQPTIDPAVETELMLVCKELGFEVIDPKSGSAKEADVLLSGEGFSELAARHLNLVSVKARVELKATYRKSNEVLVADREVTVVVDLSEQIAGKSALQKAGLQIAERLLPAMVQQWNKVR